MEHLNFTSKLKHFEEEINTRQNNAKINGYSKTSELRKSGIPMKKPLVSTQDLEKLKAEELKKSIELDDDDDKELGAESADTIQELSNDACFNMFLKNNGFVIFGYKIK